MSEKMTRITLPGQKSWIGFQDWGEVPTEKMIASVRRMAEDMKKQVQEIEAASDEDFKIDFVRGPLVQHFIRNIQPGRNDGS